MSNVRTMEEIIRLVRSRGVEVREMPNWRSRGSGTFEPRGGVDHHDASTRKSGEWGALGYIYDRNLSQFVVARCLDGKPKIAVCAAGRSGHAGRGGPFRFIPKDSGNRYLYGVEKANDGVGEPYTDAAIKATEVLLWAIKEVCGSGDTGMIIGHKEWAPTRKVDPSYSMNWMRDRIKGIDVPVYPSAPEHAPFTGVLRPGEMLLSGNGVHAFVHQTDGNVVLYEAGRPVWATKTDGRATTELIMQQDGNLVLYGPQGAIWSSGTDGNPGAVIVMQNDANLVIYATNGKPIWASKSATLPPPPPPPVNRPTIRRGDRGDHVRYAQQRLMAHGFRLPRYGADGGFGAETYNAVRAFQRAKGLRVDGVIGPATWRALG